MLTCSMPPLALQLKKAARMWCQTFPAFMGLAQEGKVRRGNSYAEEIICQVRNCTLKTAPGRAQMHLLLAACTCTKFACEMH
jgi:hypothetical protein